MNNLNVILKFINKNNNFSDFNLIENYINTINFGEFRGGAINDKNVNDGIINDGIINDGIINGGIINGGIINDKIINDGSINTENDKYTINEGTILFHASNSKKFNQNKIKFGDTSLYAFFTNSLDIASSTTKLYNSKEKENFIHVFKTKKNIDNLVFDLVNDKSNTKINNSVNKNEYKRLKQDIFDLLKYEYNTTP